MPRVFKRFAKRVASTLGLRVLRSAHFQNLQFELNRQFLEVQYLRAELQARTGGAQTASAAERPTADTSARMNVSAGAGPGLWDNLSRAGLWHDVSAGLRLHLPDPLTRRRAAGLRPRLGSVD